MFDSQFSNQVKNQAKLSPSYTQSKPIPRCGH